MCCHRHLDYDDDDDDDGECHTISTIGWINWKLLIGFESNQKCAHTYTYMHLIYGGDRTKRKKNVGRHCLPLFDQKPNDFHCISHFNTSIRLLIHHPSSSSSSSSSSSERFLTGYSLSLFISFVCSWTLHAAGVGSD